MVLLDKNMLEFVSRNPSQTQRLGARLGTLLRGGEVVCLEGPLGSGKTCLAQGVGRGWGVEQRLISPTFVLVREYERPEDGLRLYHVDLYRISSLEEAWSLGIEEFLGDERAVCIVEWAERAYDLMPSEHLWIKLGFTDHVNQFQRTLHFAASGERHNALLQEYRRIAFGA